MELCYRAERLLFVFLHFGGFEILGFEDLMTVETLDVIDAISPGNHLGALVLTTDLHKDLGFNEIYSTHG